LKIGHLVRDTKSLKFPKMTQQEIVAINTSKYFELFNQKNIQGIGSLYHQNVRLKDWEGEWVGRESVLNTNSGLFGLDFDLRVIHTDIIGNKSYNKITIKIGEDLLDVMDVITFENYNIIDITAYKG
jgi:hypothetical protein